MSPTVSVLIPCYNAKATIVETIEGLLAQTIEDWECILVSDDGTSYLDYLAGQGIRDARLSEHPERTQATGTVAPRNRGMSLVEGAYVADLDADDIWKPTRLERLLPLAEEHGCVQDVLECFSEDGVIGWSGTPDGSAELLAPEGVLSLDFPFHLIVRRELAGAIWSPYDSWVPDVVRTLRFAADKPVCWLHEPLLRYRVSGASMSQSLDGSVRIDRAYADILSDLDAPGAYGLSDAARHVAGQGVRRKQALNRRYMEAVSDLSDPPPFLAWILANGFSGVAVS